MFRSKPVGLLLKILCLILVVYMALTFLHVRRQISDTKNTIETLTQQVNDQTQTNTELSNAIENRDDPSTTGCFTSPIKSHPLFFGSSPSNHYEEDTHHLWKSV